MTREEAIQIFNEVLLFGKAQCTQTEFKELAKMSIKALAQEPCCNCIEFKRYAKEMGFEIEREPILDKIKAEIKYFMFDVNPSSSESDYACNYILDIIDKLKGESEG